LRNVRLNAKVADSCATMDGTLVVRRTGRRAFAASASSCGDGRLDVAAGETCETAADCPAGDACAGCVCGFELTARKRKTTTTTTTTSTSTSMTITSTTRPPSTTSSS